MGLYKGDEASVKAMVAKYSDGTVVKLSKVAFDGAVDAQYIHTPKQVVIDMKRTTILILAEVQVQMVKSLPGLTVIPVIVRGWAPAFSMVKAPDEELLTIAGGRTTV